jgi:hypothetical protein
MMTFDEFYSILAAAAPHADALDRTVAAVQSWQQQPDFDDDFSLVEFQM